MNVLRNSFIARCLASFLLTTFVSQIFFPTVVLALTSGPSQPEVQSFQAASTTDMVNLFSGDFNYNIPLFELPGPNGGYPFNLAYNSGITMDQEASWVGLGWNLNPGALNREMRGLPDDFNGDAITKQVDMRNNFTFGIGGSAHSTLGLEIAGFDPDAGSLGFGIGMSIFYNSYNGVGYSLDPSANFSLTNKNNMTVGIGLDITLNSQEGVGLNPSVSLSSKSAFVDKSVSIGIGYNSNAGMTSLNLNGSIVKHNSHVEDHVEHYVAAGVYLFSNIRSVRVRDKGSKSIKLGASYSFGTSSYTPSMKIPTQSRNVTLSSLQGGDPATINLYVGTSGFFNTQYISNKMIVKSGYGYLYMQNDVGQDDLLDYSRSQDGQILKNTPFLPAPSLTQDVYSANAQGLSAMYRPQRSDLGIIYDDQNTSNSAGGSAGPEVGFFTAGEVTELHFGGDMSVNYSVTNSGLWRNENNLNNNSASGFQPSNPLNRQNALYETSYFKVYGEMSSDPISKFDALGGYEAYRVSLDDHTALSTLENDHGSSSQRSNAQLGSFYDPLYPREIRETSIIPFKNSDITNVNGTFNANSLDDMGNPLTNTVGGGLSEFTFSYFTNPNSASNNLYKTGGTQFSRANLNGDHIGGFVTTNPNGMKYVYGLPAYNSKKVECQFSVEVTPSAQYQRVVDIDKNGTLINYKTSQTNQYYNKVTTPAYAHSYLLTSVLGADYIDADDVVGPSEGDLGYWVKFSYVKAVSNYKWRSPFAGANYIRGSNTTPVDDISMYMYGEKEIWHLAKAETQSHVAVFYMSPRPDGQGAYNELQNTLEVLPLKTTPNTSYELDKISLFTRNDYMNAGKPLVSANLKYSNDLCTGVLNNSAGSGKLTLTNLSFTYGDNTRSLSPYTFDYHQSNPTPGLIENPVYLEQGTDRWGMYKPYSTATDNKAPTIAQSNPYTSQFDNTGALTPAAFRAQMDNQASVWTLKSITLPSGGIMNVTYEADDYAYVQNKVATQMMPIAGMNTIGNFNFGSVADIFNLKICFPLETPITTAITPADIQKEIQKYIPDNNQIYFKTYSSFSSIGNLNMSDYVSGYADIDTRAGLMGMVETAPPYKTGYITLKPSPAGSSQYHPFALAAWLHVRTEAPYLMNIANMKADPNTNEGNKMKKLASLMSNVEDIRRIFNGFYNECDRKGFGKIIDPSRSFIRLNSPDKIKIGGGLRVKQIVLNDNWSKMTLNAGNEKNSYYGQAYNYTMEENGSIISSGVAVNEPQVGGDESPLRYTESYIQKVPALTPNRLLIEHPINDAYYPGESVGYRKVTVKSIASSYSGSNNNYDIPAGIIRSGAIMYDFYTAKDFPIIEKYTNTVSHPENIPIPIPFIGRTDINKLTMSQGFYIELNDMHGKLKAMTNYGLDKSGNINPQAIEYTKYNYQATPVYDPLGTQSNSISPNNGSGEIVSYILNNKVKVLVSDDGVFNSEPRYMGQDVEFFTDMRETESQSYSGGVNINFEVEVALPVGLSFPDIQPSANVNYARCRTTVSNKIVHKSGILTSIENFKDGSKTIATHTLFDPYTGEPLLTQVNNSYEDPVYKYELPAHMVKEYTRMGGKYATQGVKCNLILTNIGSSVYSYSMPLLQVSNVALFQKGDKVFVNTGLLRYPAVITAISTTASSITGNITVLNNATIPNNNNGLYTVEMYDPVYDNTFDENAFAVTSLQDPTANRVDKNCSVNYTYPVKSQVCVSVVQPTGCMNSMLSLLNSYFSTYNNSSTGYNYGTYNVNNGNICKSPDAQPITYNAVHPEDYQIRFMPLNATYNDPRTLMIEFWNENGQVYKGPPILFTYISAPIFTGNDFYPNIYYDAGVNSQLDYNRVDPYNVGADYSKRFYSKYKVHITYTNGASDDAYVFFWVQTDSNNKKYFNQFLDYLNPTQICKDTTLLTIGTINPIFKTLSKVINVSATVFSEFKPLDNNSVESKAIPSTARLQAFDQLVSYLNGSAGTFRPKESWTYLDDRSQTTPVTLRTDGTFGDVPFFKHNSPLCKGCPARWKKVVMFTDYFPSGTPQEEQDVLGNKSAVLFGYSGAQVTAVAANTSVYEIGFEGFEDYPNISSTNTAPSLQNYYIGKSNLNFYDASMNRPMDAFANYKIVSANQNMLIIDKPYNTNIEVLAVDVDGQDIATGATISGRYTVQRTQIYPGDASKTIIVLNTTTLNNATPWMGTGKFKLKQSSRVLNTSTISSTYVPSINSMYAHTGKFSLGIPGSCTFEQRRLVLTPGKKMVFEAWVKMSSPNPNAGVRFFDKTGQIITASNIDFGLTSIVVEGWTKIYGEFVVPTNAESLGICLFGGTGQYAPGSSFFDDIRVYPSESNMVSYVYDRLNFRLMAVLDNNNFATYYYYNPSGGLYLTKKETERGILTVQEVTQSQSKTQP
jgi:hypothetical protein